MFELDPPPSGCQAVEQYFMVNSSLSLTPFKKYNKYKYYCIEGTEKRQLGFKVRRLLFLNRY
jgi:hypothetical protein